MMGDDEEIGIIPHTILTISDYIDRVRSSLQMVTVMEFRTYMYVHIIHLHAYTCNTCSMH